MVTLTTIIASTSIDDKGVHVSREYSIGAGKTLNDLTVGDIVTVTFDWRNWAWNHIELRDEQ